MPGRRFLIYFLQHSSGLSHLSPGLQIPAGHSLQSFEEELLFAIKNALDTTKRVAPIKITFFMV